MSKPRVLLVEDDRMLRQFVRMALEDLEMELLEADCVAAAKGLLAQGAPQLILTDLMMPGESGLDLLEYLEQHPDLRGGARIVVLSAGVNAEMRQHLQAYDIWRLLLKPVPVAELESCVREALADSAPKANSSAPAISMARADAVAAYFGGDQRLFDTYLASCLAQFPADILSGNQMLENGDLPGVRLLAHSLKSVLRTLGFSAADLAQTLETDCVAGRVADAAQHWDALRAQIQALIQQH